MGRGKINDLFFLGERRGLEGKVRCWLREKKKCRRFIIIIINVCCSISVNLNCDVKEVRVTPCPETEQNKPCLVKRGKRVKIEFDYTTNGNYSDLETRAYWASATGDLPWIGMDTNGCAHTECPTQNEKSEKFLYDLKIGNKFPVVSFPSSSSSSSYFFRGGGRKGGREGSQEKIYKLRANATGK